MEYHINRSYRLLNEPNQKKPPPQFKDFVGMYVYQGRSRILRLHTFAGIHYLRGCDNLSFTDDELKAAKFEEMPWEC